MSEVTEPQAREAVKVLLGYIGEDPERDGLLDTPKRVAKALREMTEGYREDPKAILSTNFDVPFDQMVTLKDIPFVSMCEHHMLPFEGKASVAYIPNGRVVGLSKLARVVDTFAKRLQVQERLTQEIADAVAKLATDCVPMAGDYFNFRCPLAGESKIGRTWRDTH